MADQTIRIPAKGKHTASFIFLHGLGDNGRGWTFLAEESQRGGRLNHVKFIFPDAPTQPVSMNYGMTMTAWYDLKTLGDVENMQDEEGILNSIERLKQLISEEEAEGIPSDRIIVGGFSQGCAISLSTSLILEKKLGAVIGLSGYLPIKDILSTLQTDANKQTPYLICHGTSDNVIKFFNGQNSCEYLKQLFGREHVEWNQYQDMVHTASTEEVLDVISFIERVVPEEQQLQEEKAAST